MDGKRVSAASKVLLRSGFEPRAVAAFLEALGASIDADRAYVFEYDRDDDGALPAEAPASQRYEWNSGSAEPQIDNPELQALPMQTYFPRWVAAFEAGEDICGLVRDFPLGERDILEPQDIRSILVCPIREGGEVWGFVGFDDCRSERAWTAEERRVLAHASRALAAALRHHTLKQRLAVARSALHATMDAIGR